MTTILLIILLFALIQSLFGVGLLVFGTPTLILGGYSFVEALNILLPASITISILQVLDHRPQKKEIVSKFFRWCIPTLVLSLGIYLSYGLSINLYLILGVILIFFGALGVSSRLSNKTKKLVMKTPRIWLVVMGAIHGVSNLGGSLLPILAVSAYPDKINARAFVALCYFSFGIVQLGVFAFMGLADFGLKTLLIIITAGAVYLAFGRRAFTALSETYFKVLFNAVMILYGVALIYQGVYL